MFGRVSLANKCLMLFGAAVVFIIAAALTVPFLRLAAVSEEQERETSRRMVGVWEAAVRLPAGSIPLNAEVSLGDGRIRVYTIEQAAEAGAPEFVKEAAGEFRKGDAANELAGAQWAGFTREYRFAKAVRDAGGKLIGLIALERSNRLAGRGVAINVTFLLSAALVALGLAVMVFYLIINHLILGPVRLLRETAEDVREGHLDTRSDIHTGDEFEELADTFNNMLVSLQDGQRNLRAINAALETRVGALEAEKVALSEAGRVKNQFLANVSHELRTPMNSVLGFADLLLEAAEREQASGDDSTRLSKRKRYLENIVSSGRHLLDLINSLLEMAKIEAGKIDVHVEDIRLEDFAGAMLALMRPIADRKGVELRLETPGEPLVIRTDRQKLQQVVFNLMSNAVKFSAPVEGAAGVGAAEPVAGDGVPPAPRPAVVTLRVEALLVREPGADTASDRVRISVLDTGPGISPEDLAKVFEKFTQLDRGYGRRHEGTGLGLSISRELTHLLGGEIQVHSEPGAGSMFSVILPAAYPGGPGAAGGSGGPGSAGASASGADRDAREPREAASAAAG